MTDVDGFRSQLVEFLERELPAELGELPPATAAYWGGRKPELPHPQSQRYCERMAARGLTAPTWPRDYGGGSLDKDQAKVLLVELRRLRLPLPLVGSSACRSAASRGSSTARRGCTSRSSCRAPR